MDGWGKHTPRPIDLTYMGNCQRFRVFKGLGFRVLGPLGPVLGPYYNRDLTRDHNFDSSPYTSKTTIRVLGMCKRGSLLVL